jgi:hypothetical protein
MTDRANANRDQVLLAFHQACEVPTVEDVIAWTEKYPDFADDIRDHAAILRDWAAQHDLSERVPEEIDLTNARSRALSALHAARIAERVEVHLATATFDAMMKAKGTTIPALARSLDIDRTILAAMVGGRMHRPVGGRLISAWTSFFSITREAFENALSAALGAPRLGFAKADAPPTINTRSYEDLVRSSTTMPPERISYWLDGG